MYDTICHVILCNLHTWNRRWFKSKVQYEQLPQWERWWCSVGLQVHPTTRAAKRRTLTCSSEELMMTTVLWWCQQVITSVWHNLTFRHVLHGSHTIDATTSSESTRDKATLCEARVQGEEGQSQKALFPSHHKNSRKNKSCQSWVICCN